ncbi:hypothetical protein CBS101457_006777 [Exobasidium rhododendri]|nr:hypothetical protein CBS101457_006777 [Exobasidium rhododendri]
MVLNTPVVTTCQNTSLTWTGAAPGNVYLSVVPGGQPTADPIKSFPPIQSSVGTFTWLVDQPSGTSLTFLMTDSTGLSTGTVPVIVKTGVDTDCIGKEDKEGDLNGSSDSKAVATPGASSDDKTDAEKSSSKDTAKPASSSSSSNSSKTTSTDAKKDNDHDDIASSDSTSPAPDSVSTITPLPIISANASTSLPTVKNATTSELTSSGSAGLIWQQQKAAFGSVALLIATTLLFS